MSITWSLFEVSSVLRGGGGAVRRGTLTRVAYSLLAKTLTASSGWPASWAGDAFRQKRCLFLRNFPPATHRFTCNSVSLSLTKLLHFNIHTILVSNLRYDTMLSFPYHISLKPYLLDLLRVTFLRVCLDAVTRAFKQQCAWKRGRGERAKEFEPVSV